MTVTVTNLGALIYGIKLSFCYQFTTGGKEYVVASYVKFSEASGTPYFAIWNLTDDTKGLVPGTAAVAGEEVYPIVYCTDLLDNGNLAVVNRRYYIELDLVNKSIAFSNGFSGDPPTVNTVSQGTDGLVVIAQGSGTTNMWLTWCDQGGGNWDGVQLSVATVNQVLRSPCSMLATDTDHYVYCHPYSSNNICAVNTRTKVQTNLSLSEPLSGKTDAYLMQVTVGGVDKVYVNADDSWYDIDGLGVTGPVSAPSTYYHKHDDIYSAPTGHWFTSEDIAVDNSAIMPNVDDEVSISVGGVAKTLSPVTTYALVARTFSPVHPTSNYCLVQGADYGPTYKFFPTSGIVEFLGYDYGNVYFDLWDAALSRWYRLGYDTKLALYNPVAAWTSTPITDPLTTNPLKKAPGVGFSVGNHYEFPVIASDGNIYFTSLIDYILGCYDGNTTWTDFDLKTLLTLNDCKIIYLCLINSGTEIVVSTTDQDAPAGDWVGRLHVFDVATQTFVRSLTPDATATDVGVMCEVVDGEVVLVSGNKAAGCKAYRVDTSLTMPTALTWDVDITGNAFNIRTDGMTGWGGEYCHIEVAPNGLVYLYIGTDIYSLNPSDGTLTLVLNDTGDPAAPDATEMRWVGKTLYVYNSGTTNIYAVTGIVPYNPRVNGIENIAKITGSGNISKFNGVSI